jgi:hypothetical protein
MPDDKDYPKRPLLHRDWTPEEADGWTKHDVVAAVLSSLCYLLVAVGVAGTLLFEIWGLVSLLASIVCAWWMFRVIDPKMKAMSLAFEGNQAGYLERVERRTRWESEP